MIMLLPLGLDLFVNDKDGDGEDGDGDDEDGEDDDVDDKNAVHLLPLGLDLLPSLVQAALHLGSLNLKL